MKPTAVVFAYHDVGVRGLLALIAGGIDVALVVTHEDDPQEPRWFASVAATAREHDLETLMPRDVDAPEVVQRIRAAAPDFFFTLYYRQLLGPALLALPRRGGYNVHGSLLPAFRGRAPVNWAVLSGARETGASLHELVARADAGPLVDRFAVPILPDDTAFDVHRKVVVAAEIVLTRSLPAILAGTARATPLDLAAGSYFGRRTPADGRIDPHWPAARIHDLVRAVSRPYPGAFLDLPSGRLRLWRTRRLGDSGPAGAPALLRAAGCVLLRAGDGGLLRVLDAELGDAPCTHQALGRILGGAAALPLSAADTTFGNTL